MSTAQASESSFDAPLYPHIRVHTESTNPLALVAAIRLAMRQARVGRPEIARFTREAMSGDPTDTRRVCRTWVAVTGNA